MPRRPNKPKKGEPYRLHVILSGDLVDLIDRYAAQVSTKEALLRSAPVTRTDAIKLLLVDALKHHGLIK